MPAMAELYQINSQGNSMYKVPSDIILITQRDGGGLKTVF